MLKMNRTSKLLNSLALVAVLTTSTAVYAMNPDDDRPAISPGVSFNEDVMEKARDVARGKILDNFYAHESSDVNRKLYERMIAWYEKQLRQSEFVDRLNNDILVLLKEGTRPTAYFDYEKAFDGVAEALAKKGITLETLIGKAEDRGEALKEKGASPEALEEDTPHKRRHCTIS